MKFAVEFTHLTINGSKVTVRGEFDPTTPIEAVFEKMKKEIESCVVGGERMPAELTLKKID